MSRGELAQVEQVEPRERQAAMTMVVQQEGLLVISGGTTQQF